MGYKMCRKSDKYKLVYKLKKCGSVNAKFVWFAKVGNKQKHFNKEREAAIFVDLRLIEKGNEPVNILRRK
jgi:hypothetical protein